LQWRKTELTAKQEVQYLGVLLDLALFQYKAPPGKLKQVQQQAQELLQKANKGESLGARQLAQWLGCLAALR
jgi:ABC-type Na+ transport system ATPase subunit NatA